MKNLFKLIAFVICLSMVSGVSLANAQIDYEKTEKNVIVYSNPWVIYVETTKMDFIKYKTVTDKKGKSKKVKKVRVTGVEKKFYKRNISTGVKRYRYKEIHWNIKMYKKKSGKWKYVGQESGSSRIHGDPKSFLEAYIYGAIW